MKRLPYFLFVLLVLMSFTRCTNPSVDAGEVGMVTNEPFFFGEKGEFLAIIVGPSSYGLGWRNKIKYIESAKPFTYKEHFSPKGGSGNDKERDSRIMSSDDINMEVSVSVVVYIRNSPATAEADVTKFKENARAYFEKYINFWRDRYQEPFRTHIRSLLGNETYTSARKKRAELSLQAKKWLEEQLADTPIGIAAVNISNINPPQRMLDEQEILKATEIAERRQKKEKLLQESRNEVMQQEARNLRDALNIAPQYLRFKDLEIKQKYVDAFNVAITGEEARSIDKMWFIPYGTPVAAGGNQEQAPSQQK